MGNINWNIPKIDAHVHFNYERVALLNYGAKNNIKYLSINTDIPFFKPLEDQEKTILKLKYAVGNQLHYVASFPMANWGSLNWESDVLSILKKSFSIRSSESRKSTKSPLAIPNPWFLHDGAPLLTEFLISFTHGKLKATRSGPPSVEPSSTTITSNSEVVDFDKAIDCSEKEMRSTRLYKGMIIEIIK